MVDATKPADFPGAGPDALLQWLDSNVEARLSRIEEKLDRVLAARPGLATAPPSGLLELPAPATRPRLAAESVFGVPEPPVTARRRGFGPRLPAQKPDPREDTANSEDTPSDRQPVTARHRGLGPRLAAEKPNPREDTREDALGRANSEDTRSDRSPSVAARRQGLGPSLPVQKPAQREDSANSANTEDTFADAIIAVNRRTTASSLASFSHRMNEWLQARQRSETHQFIYGVLEDSESSRLARWYERAMPVFIFVTVCLTLLQAVEDPPLSGVPAAVLETAVEGIFTVEIITRFVVCPSKKAFFKNIYNFIDIMAVAPLGFRAAVGFVLLTQDGDGGMRKSITLAVLLGAVPVLRLLKVLRRFQQFHLLLKAFQHALEALPVMIFFYLVLLLCVTGLIFVFEAPEDIPSLTMAMWLAFTSLSTVGYGDFAPRSTGGRVAVAIFVFMSMLYMSIPLGIIGNAFSEVWGDRDRILLMQKTRHRLLQWGYQAEDIPQLFRFFDQDMDKELNFDEFKNMVAEMKLGLRDARVVELFRLFDNDQSGAITDSEFVRGLFPETFHKIYGSERSSAQRSSRRSSPLGPSGCASFEL